MAKVTKPITEGQREKASRLFGDGELTVAEVAKKCGLTHRQARRLYEKLGLSSSHGSRRKLKADKKAKTVQGEVRAGGSFEDISKRTGIPLSTVRDSARRKVEEEKEVQPAGGCPESSAKPYLPVHLDDAGNWLILSDVHIPCHDRKTCELAIDRAKRDGVVGVILNGDFLDSHDLSDHDKDPSAPRYNREIELGLEFLAWVRGELPHARIVYKMGNHEERLQRYVFSRAPALFDLEFASVPSLLHFDEFGIETVTDRRVMHLGKLCVIHGHEYRGSGGVFAARWLSLRTKYPAICGHFHRTSNYFDRTIVGKMDAAWTVGCACDLTPMYTRLNSWNNGFAMVEVGDDGGFEVRNLRVMNGKVL